jgi:dynein heavy chain 1
VSLEGGGNLAAIGQFVENGSSGLVIFGRGEGFVATTERGEAHGLCLLVTKKSSFSLEVDGGRFSQMVQVVPLELTGEHTVMALGYSLVHDCLLPLLVSSRQEIEKKSARDRNSYNSLLRKMNEVDVNLMHCQNSVKVQEVQLRLDDSIRPVLARADPELAKEQVDALVESVMQWGRDISRLNKLTFDLEKSSIMQEQKFWSSYHSALRAVDQQLEAEEVQAALECLKRHGRLQPTISFESEKINLKNGLSKVARIEGFMSELPIESLLACDSLEELAGVTLDVLARWRDIEKYPDYDAKKSVLFHNVLARDVASLASTILGKYRLMFEPFPDFKLLYHTFSTMLAKFRDEKKAFADTMMKKKGVRQEGGENQLIPLAQRLEKISKIRELHEEMKSVIESIVRKEKNEKVARFLSVAELDSGYQYFSEVNVLEMSKEGEEQLAYAEGQYLARLEKVECNITENLRQQLGATASTNEMYRIFAKFNRLFFRPRIKNAIQEYQSQLLKALKKDI